MSIVVHDASVVEALGEQADEATMLGVDVTIGGVDDPDGLDSFRLVTGDRQPGAASASTRPTVDAPTITAARSTAGSTST